MQVETSVALGCDDPALEVPWSSPDGASRFFDLRSSPELLDQVTETTQYPELRTFLARMNAQGFSLQTAKADVWITDELAADEDIHAGEVKLVSYVDLIFSDDSRRFSFPQHQLLAEKIRLLLTKAPEIPASVELIIRHCHFHHDGTSGQTSTPAPGFCITAYVSGFGQTASDASETWTIALRLLNYAIVQAESTTASVTDKG
jgi:hypothetical protein